MTISEALLRTAAVFLVLAAMVYLGVDHRERYRTYVVVINVVIAAVCMIGAIWTAVEW